MSAAGHRPRTAARADPERLWAWISLAAIVALGASAYLPVHRAGWVQDDHVAVESNPIVDRGDPREIFSTHYWAGATGEDATLYRPVPVATWALERRFSGTPSPALAHLVNLLLHLAVSTALFAVARRLGAGPLVSSAAALLFAVHPVHAEAVAGVVGRSEILAALGVVAALWFLSHAGPLPGGVRPTATVWRASAWLAAASVFVALGSKETAVAVVPLLAALELLYRRPGSFRDRGWWIERAATWAPTALAALLWFGLRARALGAWWATQTPHPVDNPLLRLEGVERIATALGLVARYVGLTVFPVALSADYSGGTIPVEAGLIRPLPLVGLAILAGTVVLAAAALLPSIRAGTGAVSDATRFRAFAAVLFLAPYLVVGNLLVPIGTIFAERLLYLPSAGLCLLAGSFLGSLALDYPAFPQWTSDQRLRYGGLILVLLVAAFAVRTYARALVWQDDRTVFAAVATSHPESPRAWFILGKLDVEDGRLEAGLASLERAVEVEPDYVPGWYEAGTVLARLGRYPEAVANLRRAVELAPGHAMAHYHLGLALQRLDRPDEARVAVRRALLHDPEIAGAWATLGHLAYLDGRSADALVAYRRAVALGRDDLRERVRALETAADGGAS